MIRKAIKKDWPEISHVSRISGYMDYINKEGEAYLDWGEVLVYEEGQIRGFTKLEYLEDGSAWFSGLRVDPAYWREGVATKLTEESIRLSASNGCKTARMLIHDENEASMSLSTKLGFSISESFYFFPGIPSVVNSRIVKTAYPGLLDVGWEFLRKNDELNVHVIGGDTSGWEVFLSSENSAQILKLSDQPLPFKEDSASSSTQYPTTTMNRNRHDRPEPVGHTCVSSRIGLTPALEPLLDLDFTFAHVLEKKIG